jgi:hypothetical protein
MLLSGAFLSRGVPLFITVNSRFEISVIRLVVEVLVGADK